MDTWRSRVACELERRRIELPDAVVDELAAHIEDAWDSRLRPDEGDPVRFVVDALARADLAALPQRATPRPVAPEPSAGGPLSGLVSELRYTVRTLGRAPIFTAAVVLVLGLGIGTTTAAFRIVYASSLAPLPYRDADRLVMVWERNLSRNRPRNVINSGNFFAWSEQSRSLEAAGLFVPTVGNLAGDGMTPTELPAMAVQASVLQMTGVQAVTGRLFTADDEHPASTRVILISEGLWRRQFGGQLDVVGRRVTFNGEPASIAGVLPSDFHVAGFSGAVWRPTLMTPDARTSFRGRSLLSLAKLRPGVTPESADAELNQLFARLVDEHPDMNTGWSLTVVPVRDQFGAETRPALLALFAAVVAVLLVACANIAALMLVRASARRHEMAVRATLGARPAHLMRHIALECGVLVLAGGLLGTGVAAVITRLVWPTARDARVVLQERGDLDVTSLGFAAVVTALVGLACALGPAWRARRSSQSGLRDGGRGVTGPARARGWLVAGEVAAATLVLSGAALLTRSYLAQQDIDPGFTAERVLSARVSRMGRAAQDSSVTFGRDVVARLRALPGVTNASATSFLPLDGQPGIGSSFWLADRPSPGPGNLPVADYRPVMPGYFATLGIPLKAGRDFTDADTEGRSLVAIVNDAFVRELSSDLSPLGRRLVDSLDQSQEIVGVVGNVAMNTLGGRQRPVIYLPHAQFPNGSLTFVVRTAQDPASLGRMVIAAIREVDPHQPVSDVRPLDDVLSASLTRPRVASTTLGLFAAAALLLAAIGIYGVVAYGVQLRRSEFGVRLALGAEPRDIVTLVVGRHAWLVGGGALAGAALSVPLSRTLGSLLYGVEPGDPVTLTGVGLLMVAAGLVASYLPARRGTRVDPTAALRSE